MRPLDAMRNVSRAVARVGRDALQAREIRARSPAFQAEMARESREFFDTLSELGSNTWNTGVGVILKTPYHLFVNALKAIHSKKYGAGNYAKDALKLFLGRDGIAHNALKVTANAVHLGAKGIKIGVRKLFAL
jgi:hypothetical protein